MSPDTTDSLPRSWQQRIRESPLGTMLVLAVTAAIVMGGAYLVDRPAAAATGTTSVKLSGTGGDAPPKIGSLAQDFTATTADGKQVSLSSFKGHPVWLTFGASWCSACVAEEPDIEAAYLKYKAQGVQVLAVSISEDAATVKAYAGRVGLTFPMVPDPNTSIASVYGVYGIPAHFFIDKAGVLRAVATGDQSPNQIAAEMTEITR